MDSKVKGAYRGQETKSLRCQVRVPQINTRATPTNKVAKYVAALLPELGHWRAIVDAKSRDKNRPMSFDHKTLPIWRQVEHRVGLLIPSSNSQIEPKKISSDALKNVRGTVQADILKEDQGQNTCIFSSEFSNASSSFARSLVIFFW